MNTRKKALAILIEVFAIELILNAVFAFGLKFIKDNEPAQLAFAVLMLIMAICVVIVAFRFNLKGITWKDVPWKYFFLIPLASVVLKFLVFQGVLSMLQEVFSKYVAGDWLEYIIDNLYSLPWTYFLYYSIANQYYKNRETKKEFNNNPE